jgi:hypothetical protein
VRPGFGQPRPRGIAANEPRIATGTAGTPAPVHSRAAPGRNRPTQPSLDRVPSGNTTMLHPSPSNRHGVSDSRRPPDRSTGNALNTSAVPAARPHPSKK